MKKRFIGILIGVLLVITSISVMGEEKIQSTTYDDTNISPFANALVRIDISEGNVQLPKGLEIVGGQPGEYLNVILPQERLSELSDRDISYSVEIDDIDAYSQAFAGQYHTLAEMEQILHDIADNYPEITSLYSIGTTYEGRDIWCLEITDNPGVDEGEPGVFYMGLHHAREWPTVEICLNIADKLTSEYGSDPDITDVVNNRRLWLVTCENPDGYYYCHDQGHDWRKNRQYFPDFGTYGVDLNRNYAGSSDGDAKGMWGSLGQASVTHNPAYSVYCGPGPMSELETQAIRDMFIENDICAAITWHTHGELVLWPWGYTYSNAPDATYMSTVGQEIASRISRQSGGGTYTPSQASGLYPTTGDTCDWAYGYYQYVLGRPLFIYTIEACNEFHPPQNYLDQIVEENFDGALYLLQEAENISNTVIPRVIPPIIDDLSNSEYGNYNVSWQEQNPEAAPLYFQLDELAGLSLSIDDAESGSDLWDLGLFSISDARYHSDSQSYKAGLTNEKVASMTTTYPLPVTEDMSLSFWCWYDIEEQWDFAFVEVSRDGRSYEVLGSFTGTSDGWQYKECDLNAYNDDSVFVRFRYTTDSETTGEGFYVDDIYPIADFGTVTTLSDSIEENYFEVTERPNNTYCYRVRGYNDERGWGDFSSLEKVVVGDGGDNEPPIFELIKPKMNYLYLMNRELIPFLTTFIIGTVDIEVTASDPSGVDRVELFVDGSSMGVDTAAPYNWTWDERIFFRHTIKIMAYDTFENGASAEFLVWKFF